jgi:hypothetical protein
MECVVITAATMPPRPFSALDDRWLGFVPTTPPSTWFPRAPPQLDHADGRYRDLVSELAAASDARSGRARGPVSCSAIVEG